MPITYVASPPRHFTPHSTKLTSTPPSPQFDYLIHSILALSASHLNACSTSSLSAAALTHRITAVRSLNAALSNPDASKSERDAMMATALALTFQSSYMRDGLAEFYT